MFILLQLFGAIHIWFEAVGFIISLLLRARSSMSNEPIHHSSNPFSNNYVGDKHSRSGSSAGSYVHQQRDPYIPPESMNAPKNPKFNHKSKYNANEPTLISNNKKTKKYASKMEVKNVTDGDYSYTTNMNQNKKSVYGSSPDPAKNEVGPTAFENIYMNYIKPLLPVQKEPQKVIKRHLPTLEDEVYLEIGDRVRVDEVFDDMWAVGTNVDTEKYGAFPMSCLEGGTKKNRHESKYYQD